MNWIWKNFWLKVVAFAMGLVVWFHVATEKTYNHELKLPLAEITLKEDLTLSKEPPDSLLVAVSATGKQLLRQKWRKQGLRVNATQYQAGRYSLSVSTANTFLAHLTADVSLDEVISPRQVQLDIDVRSSTDITITADVETLADEGFSVGREITIDPPTARLVGPRSTLGRVTAILTEQKRLAGLRNDVNMTLGLILPPGYGYELEPDSVRIAISVVPVRTRVYEDIPVIVFNAPPSVSVATDPPHISVEMTGPPEDIDQLSRNAVTVSVDYRQVTEAGWARVKVDCPPGFRLKKTSADAVLIQVDSGAHPGN